MFIEKMWAHTPYVRHFIDELPTTLLLCMWLLVPSFDMLCSRHKAVDECIYPSISKRYSVMRITILMLAAPYVPRATNPRTTTRCASCSGCRSISYSRCAIIENIENVCVAPGIADSMYSFVPNANIKTMYRVKGVPSNGGGLNTLVMFIEGMWTHTLVGATFH